MRIAFNCFFLTVYIEGVGVCNVSDLTRFKKKEFYYNYQNYLLKNTHSFIENKT